MKHKKTILTLISIIMLITLPLLSNTTTATIPTGIKLTNTNYFFTEPTRKIILTECLSLLVNIINPQTKIENIVKGWENVGAAKSNNNTKKTPKIGQ